MINGKLEDDEEDIIHLLNNEEILNENKIIIIDRYNKSFNEISKIENSLWEYLLKNK